MEHYLSDATAWVALSFVIFVIAAYFLGRKSIADGLDARIEGIRKDIATAEALKAEAQALLADYTAKQEAAMRDASQMVETAKAQASEIARQAEEQFAVTMNRKEAMMKDRLTRMEDTAMDDIRRYAAELAISATTQIIAQKMDATSAQSLADTSISNIAGKLN